MTDEEIKSYVQSAVDGLKERITALEEKIAGLEKKAKQKGRAGWYAGKR
jgi:hypothetical protein